MKYVVSISLLFFYLAGTFHSSWTLVEFYWNRDDYTQKFCQLLDQGITQCRASCYLEDLLDDKSDTSGNKILSNHKIKITELTNFCDSYAIRVPFSMTGLIEHNPSWYAPDYYPVIFHPPKA